VGGPARSQKIIYQSQAEKMIVKTALGAEKNIPWEKNENLNAILEKLKKEKIKIIALETAEGSLDLKKFKPIFPMALILGNETDGINQDILSQCDRVVSIPMRGKKESLNVSVAAGIAIYGILK